MSRSYHTKNRFKNKKDQLEQRRREIARANGADYSDMALSTLDLYYRELTDTRSTMSRHPGGTRAKGLGRLYRGKTTVKAVRNRFGLAEEQSSRLRKERRAALHAARQKAKRACKIASDPINL